MHKRGRCAVSVWLSGWVVDWLAVTFVETAKDTAIVAMDANRKPHSSFPMVGPYHFYIQWVTSNPDFKVTPLFDAEYLINGTTYGHSFNEY